MFPRVVFVFFLMHMFTIRNCLPQSYESQKTQIFAYNVLLNGFIGGIGGAINKNKQDKLFKVFAKNFLVGCLGGTLKYFAKYDHYNLNYYRYYQWNSKSFPLQEDDTFRYNGWLDRLIYFTGHSLVHNASLNKKLWDSFQINIYGAHLTFSFSDSVCFKPRVSLLTLINLTTFILEGHTLDIKNSLHYGLYYFQMRSNDLSDMGISGYNSIAIIQNNWTKGEVLVHEMIHTYQDPDYFPISNFFSKPSKPLKSFKLIKALDKYLLFDIPYFWLFYELQQPYYKNFYEFEVQHFATRAYIDR